MKQDMAHNHPEAEEINLCTLEDIKAAPSGSQILNKSRLKKKRPFSLEKVNKLAADFWETPEEQAV